MTDTNMMAWAQALEGLKTFTRQDDLKRFAKALREPRLTGWKRVKELGLPNDTPEIFPLTVFLRNPEFFLPKRPGKWLVLLEPKKINEMRYRKASLETNEIFCWIKDVIEKNNLNSEFYDLALGETHQSEYGGNIIITHEGKILIEFTKGGQGVISEGKHNQAEHGELFLVRRDEHMGSFKYSWADEDGKPTRESIYKVLMKIPHNGTGRDRQFLPGYYEFQLIDRGNGLEPLFFDCRIDPPMLNI